MLAFTYLKIVVVSAWNSMKSCFVYLRVFNMH